jgi:hypothetical protein
MDKNGKHEYSNPYDKLLDKFGMGEERPLTPAEEARANDRLIETAVLYVVTKGYTDMPPARPAALDGLIGQGEGGGDPEQMAKENAKRSAYTDEITRLFTQFKAMVVRGDISIEELENKVYADFGVVSERIRRLANPLEFDPEVKFMSQEEYDLMRESYDGSETER